MSILIDKLISSDIVKTEIDEKWYIAKPMGIFSLMDRIKGSYRILNGSSRAFHYKSDEKNKEK